MSACTMCAWDPERKVKRSWTVRGAGPLPSQNAIGGNGQGFNGSKYRKWRNGIERAIKDQLNEIPRARVFRAAIVTRYYGKSPGGATFRAYDHENFVGGCKPLVDVLRAYGVIYNDNAAYWRGYYRQQPSPNGETFFTITLYEFAD